MIRADLRAVGPMDLVLLNLHGAMVAEGYDDCESDLVVRALEIVGPAPSSAWNWTCIAIWMSG